MIWITSDQHYGHANILHYAIRPFENVQEMDRELIRRHNEVVQSKDTVYIVGDFTLNGHDFAVNVMEQLNGNLVFLPGSHDGRWFDRNLGDGRIRCVDSIYIIEKAAPVPIVLCHYAMLRWPRSHYKSWCLVGHSHGKLASILPDSIEAGLQLDVGVDVWNYYPVSLEKVTQVMRHKEELLIQTGYKWT